MLRKGDLKMQRRKFVFFKIHMLAISRVSISSELIDSNWSAPLVAVMNSRSLVFSYLEK